MSGLILSLSSIPPRFAQIGATLQALRAQCAQIDKILLYIPQNYRRFPEWDGALPEVPEGVEIRRCDNDLGPATKVLVAAQEFRGQDVDILFGDDDRDYKPGWAQVFVNARKFHPEMCIANLGLEAGSIAESVEPRALRPRAERRWRITDIEFQSKFLLHQLRAGRSWRSVPEPPRRVFKSGGYADIFEGCGGVMVRPDFFDEMAYDIPPVLWTVDDVWLSGMLAQRGIPIWVNANQYEPGHTAAEALNPLVTSVVDGADRRTANRLAVEYMQTTFGIWG